MVSSDASCPAHDGQAPSSDGASPISAATLPLSIVDCGVTVRVMRVRGRDELRRRLETLGFVEGASVKVLSKQAGDLIVEIKGTHVAIEKDVATKIITG